MENETEKDVVVETPEGAAPEAAPEVVAAAPEAERAQRGRGGRTPGGRGGRRPSTRPPRQKSEFDQKMINIRRVARVMAGGRRFSFSVAIIIGNKKGKVGVGLGKAGDTTLAIDKAVRDAKKRMITVPLTKNNSIAHDVDAKYNASRIMLIPAKGRGLVAGSSVRPVLELAGVTDVIGKIHSGSKNGLNNARAAIEALKNLK
ncbi:30S ribosomal protein S5 [Candidatus Nomurabacteria bacterium]|nr:30S ribosomal protein S5 [Candidatus Nomurabacteria bacterium]